MPILAPNRSPTSLVNEIVYQLPSFQPKFQTHGPFFVEDASFVVVGGVMLHVMP